MKWQIFNVPKYSEISVEKLWEMVKDWDDLMKHFPDLDPTKLPKRRFILSVLWTLRTNEMKELIRIASSNRCISNKLPEDELVAMIPIIKEKIFQLFPKKSMVIYIVGIVLLATPGRAAFLLKQGAKLHRTKARPKKYKVDLDILRRIDPDEEEKGDD